MAAVAGPTQEATTELEPIPTKLTDAQLFRVTGAFPDFPIAQPLSSQSVIHAEGHHSRD